MSRLSSGGSSSRRMCAAFGLTTVMISCAVEPEGEQAPAEADGLAVSSGELKKERHCSEPRHCRARCNDHNPCTVDTCVEGACVHSPEPYGTTATRGRNRCGEAEVCDGHGACVQPGAPLWARRWPPAAVEFGSMTVDRAGDILLSGSFSGTVDLGAGPLTSAGNSDILIVKLDEDGALLWGRRYGGPGSEDGPHLAVLGDGSLGNAGGFVESLDVGTGLIPSAGLSDIYVMQTDPGGNPRWIRAFGDPEHQNVSDTTVDTDDEVVLAGSFEGTVDFGAGPHASLGAQDAFLLKLDRSGNTVWSKIFGTDASDGVTAVSVDQQGSVVFIGSTSAGLDLGGGPLAPARAFIAKLDIAGNHVWSKVVGDGFTYLQDIDADRAGNLIVSGSTPTTIDLGAGPLVNEGWGAAFIAMLDTDGNAVWSRSFTTAQSFTVIGSVAADNQGNVITSGVLVSDVANSSIDFDGTPFSSGNLRGSYSARTFLAKFDAADGRVLWVKGFDTEGLYDVATSRRDRVLARGDFTGTIDFGTGPLTATSEANQFIAAFGP